MKKKGSKKNLQPNEIDCNAKKLKIADKPSGI